MNPHAETRFWCTVGGSIAIGYAVPLDFWHSVSLAIGIFAMCIAMEPHRA